QEDRHSSARPVLLSFLPRPSRRTRIRSAQKAAYAAAARLQHATVGRPSASHWLLLPDLVSLSAEDERQEMAGRMVNVPQRARGGEDCLLGHESATASAFAEVEDDLLARDLLVLVEQIQASGRERDLIAARGKLGPDGNHY